MYYWISYGDEALLAHGTPHQSGQMTLEEALNEGRYAISRGDRVVEIRGPNGEVWKGQQLADLLAKRES